MQYSIIFHGRNTRGIFEDACTDLNQFGWSDGRLIIVTREEEREPVPDLRGDQIVVRGSEFQPVTGSGYIVVANGGTTEQFFPVVTKLLKYYYTDKSSGLRFYNVQRDGSIELLLD